MIRNLLGATVALVMSVGAAQAGPTVSVSSWLAPNYNDQPAFFAGLNAVQAAYQGLPMYGTPDTPSYYGGTTTSVDATQIVMTNGFTAWNGVVNPTGAYTGLHGNTAAWLSVIDGGGTEVSLAQVAFTATSSDPGNLLGFSYNFFGYGTDAYGTTVMGVKRGPNGDTFVTSGSSTQFVDAIYIAGLWNGLSADCFGCSDADAQQAILDATSALPPGVTNYTGEVTWNPGGGGIPNSQVRGGHAFGLSDPQPVQGSGLLQIINGGDVPEPTSLALVALALIGMMGSRGSIWNRRTC